MLVAGVGIYAFPADSKILPNKSVLTVNTEQYTDVMTAQEVSSRPGSTLIDPEDSELAEWTFMVYIASDDDMLENTALEDFKEMASVSPTEAVNIVVQMDRIPGYANSYDNWTDCRRFLITQGLTPTDGNEVMNLGEVNMGDPSTLADFAKWAVSNYPAEKYALVISSHGKGWEGCCWDKTSDNDNINLAELRSALGEISGFTGQPLNILGFDACLMGTVEVAYEIHEFASVMVASEQFEPASGWPYDTILTELTADPDMDAASLATIIVDKYYQDGESKGYTMSAIDLTRIGVVASNLNDLAQALLESDGTDTQVVRNCASSVASSLDEAVICEKHETIYPGSHGLAVYFPKSQEQFNQYYNKDGVSLAGDTVWEDFVAGYYAYSDDNQITRARGETQQYFNLENVDLYDFCQHLIDSDLND